MAFHQTPVCLEIIRTLADQMATLEAVFDPQEQAFQDLVTVLSGAGDLLQNPNFTQEPQIIAYLQLLMVASLSMAGGLFVPAISSFTYQKPHVTFHWGDRLVDRFTFGEIDKGFEKFVPFFQHNILGLPSHQATFDTAIFYRLSTQILKNKDLIKNVQKKWEQVQKGPHQIKSMIEKEEGHDLLFLLMSCFPPEQLNALFIKIQSHFPDELMIDSPDGNSLNVKALFQTPSTDLTYLVSKVKLYLQLFFGSNLPIIQHITQSQTRRHVVEFMQNRILFDQVQESIQSIVDQQVQPRLDLYTVLDLHLSKVIKAVK